MEIPSSLSERRLITSSTADQIDDGDAQIIPSQKVNSPAPRQEALMGPLPSMENLFWYLKNSTYEFFPNNDPVDIFIYIPWKRDIILFVLSHIFHFISSLEEHSEFDDAIIALDEKALCVRDAFEAIQDHEQYDTCEINTEQVELSEMFVNSFFPNVVPRFFTVPKLHQLPPTDKHLHPNEILAGFLNFLLQVLYHQTNISEDQVQQWSLVRKELSFLLALLGDMPFQCTHHHDTVQEINILLAEFEMLANEAGGFVYDGVFSIHQMGANKFHAETTVWFQKVELLNAKIKEHCLKFSELPMSVISRTSVVDSFFIVHSLIEDIESLKNHSLNFDHGDAIMEQIKTLHDELTLSQSFIKILRDNEEKEGLILIRDLAYEAEYLINSLVVGNIHVWYLNLRLPSIIHKIKLALIELQVQTSETEAIKAGDVKVSFPTTEKTAIMMDENHFLDFNDDIIQTILNGQSDHMKILEKGYKQLPRNIKPCFLYFAGFPKDFEISQEKLTGLWISEGFVLKEGNKSLEGTAEMYLLDLINRKLVLIAQSESDGSIKKCSIQSVLHEFCVSKATEENFMKFTNGFSMYEKCQRLCLKSTLWNYSWRPFGLHCRSYRDLYANPYSTCFQTMALLKVVHHENRNFLRREIKRLQGCPSLSFPAQLRFLSVAGDVSNEIGEFLLRDVLSYMEEYFPVEESVKKLTVIDQIEGETTSTTSDNEPQIFCNHQTYFIVVSYAMQFSSTLENLELSDTILALSRIAESYNNRKQFLQGHPWYADEIKKSLTEFQDMLVNSFIPRVQRFFEVPTMEQLPDKDKHLNKNEILASSMEFLLQILFCEVNSTDSSEAKLYSLLQKELSFLLAVLGDIPFQPAYNPYFGDEINNHLAEFEMLANEAGRFFFSCVFPVLTMKISRFHVETNALLEMAKLLNAKVKEHCTNFSELPVSAILRPSVVDSFFIVDSLIDDLQNIITNGQFRNFTPDDTMKQQINVNTDTASL